MSLQQIEDILFDGTEDDIKNLSCPECKTPIYYTYNKGAKSLKYGCKKMRYFYQVKWLFQSAELLSLSVKSGVIWSEKNIP